MENNTDQLKKVLNDYAVPDPNIVGKLPKGNFNADFIGHADINRILIEIDPLWNLEPLEIIDGRPAAHTVEGDVFMWFKMTLLGHTRLAVGSAKVKTPDMDKILYGDALRNGAMRFGIGLSLWTKQEWEDLNHYTPAPAQNPKASSRGMAPVPEKKQSKMLTPLSDSRVAQFKDACEAKGLDPNIVLANAGIPEGTQLMESHLPAMTAAFKELASFKAGE